MKCSVIVLAFFFFRVNAFSYCLLLASWQATKLKGTLENKQPVSTFPKALSHLPPGTALLKIEPYRASVVSKIKLKEKCSLDLSL